MKEPRAGCGHCHSALLNCPGTHPGCLPATLCLPRCRDNNDVFAVNAMCFHPQFGTFVTAGSDGAFNFWDKDSKQRLKAMQKCSMPIPCANFNRCVLARTADTGARWPPACLPACWLSCGGGLKQWAPSYCCGISIARLPGSLLVRR